MDLKYIDEHVKHIDDVASRFSTEEKREWNMYNKLGSSFSKWCLIALLAGVTVGAGGVVKRYNIEKYRPAGVCMYEEANARLDSARTNFAISSMNDSVRQAKLEDIAMLWSERENLRNSDINREYVARLENAYKVTVYGIIAGIILAGMSASISTFYDFKKNRLWNHKAKES
jgi:ABC-type anion transport system duplicated permease subunit